MKFKWRGDENGRENLYIQKPTSYNWLKALFNIVEERFKKLLNFDVCVV